MARRRISLGLGLLGVTASLGLTACGSVKQTLDPVASAATKTEQAGGAKLDMTVALAAAGKSFTLTASGAFDQSEGDLTMDLGSMLSQAGLSQAGLSAGDGKVELRYVKENGDMVIYMNAPFLSSKLPGGKQWVKIDLSQTASAQGLNLGSLMTPGTTQNPGDMLKLLEASGDVQKVGSATIGGESTTEYKATIDLEQAAKLANAPASAIEQLKTAGVPTSLPVEVWIGDDGLVRQMHLVEDMSVSGQSSSVDVTIDVHDYGTQVDVQAPPADQVLDLIGLLGAATSHH